MLECGLVGAGQMRNAKITSTFGCKQQPSSLSSSWWLLPQKKTLGGKFTPHRFQIYLRPHNILLVTNMGIRHEIVG